MSAKITLYTWAEKGTIRVKRVVQEHNTSLKPVIDPRLFHLGTRRLSTRPPCYPPPPHTHTHTPHPHPPPLHGERGECLIATYFSVAKVFLHVLFLELTFFVIFLVKTSLKVLRRRSCILKKMAKLFKIFISNLFQSSPSSAILVPFCFKITPLVFFFLSKPLFLGFPTL